MELWDAIRNRRSCRTFTAEHIEEKDLDKILEAAIWAPSPANNQPWEFILVSNKTLKEELYSHAQKTKEDMFRKSNWRWLGKYQVDFLLQAPTLVAVVGDPEKTGADKWRSDGGEGYKYACAAAIQNMLLMAHSLGLGSLWYTLFAQAEVKKILQVPEDRTVIGLVCLGKPATDQQITLRKPVKELTRRID